MSTASTESRLHQLNQLHQLHQDCINWINCINYTIPHWINCIKDSNLHYPALWQPRLQRDNHHLIWHSPLVSASTSDMRIQSIPDKMEFHFWCLRMKIDNIFPFSLSIFDVSVNYLPKTVSLSYFSFHFQEICAKNSIFFHFIGFPFYREWTVPAWHCMSRVG